MPKIVRSDPESFQPLQLSSFKIYTAESVSENIMQMFPDLHLRNESYFQYWNCILETCWWYYPSGCAKSATSRSQSHSFSFRIRTCIKEAQSSRTRMIFFRLPTPLTKKPLKYFHTDKTRWKPKQLLQPQIFATA